MAAGLFLMVAPGLSLEEVEENVRSNGSVLTDGNTQLAALYYVDPRRFSNEDADVDLTAGLSARVLEQNMTVSASESITPQTEEFADDILPVRLDMPIAKALTDSGYPQQYADGIAGLEPVAMMAFSYLMNFWPSFVSTRRVCESSK